jgi:hypothetical protein
VPPGGGGLTEFPVVFTLVPGHDAELSRALQLGEVARR